MTLSDFDRLIVRLAMSGGCQCYRIDPLALTLDPAPNRTYTVVCFRATPETFYKPDFERVGARNFRANPAARTVTFDVDVTVGPSRAEEILAGSPALRRMVEVLGGEVEEVEWCAED